MGVYVKESILVLSYFILMQFSAADPKGCEWAISSPPDPVKISHKKDGPEGGRIYFMFLAPSTRPLDPLL